MCVLLPRCTLCKTEREAAVLTSAFQDMTSMTSVNLTTEESDSCGFWGDTVVVDSPFNRTSLPRFSFLCSLPSGVCSSGWDNKHIINPFFPAGAVTLWNIHEGVRKVRQCWWVYIELQMEANSILEKSNWDNDCLIVKIHLVWQVEAI